MVAYWPADRSSTVLDISVGDMLREAAAAAPGAAALVAGTARQGDRRRWTYTELLEQSEQAARALLGRFEPGERVAVWANNIPEWVTLEFAAALAGITIVTVNPALRAQELTHVLGQSRANGIFLIPEYRGIRMDLLLDEVRGGLPALREVVSFADWADFTASGSPAQTLPTVKALDPAQVQYTSGTTGVPKGAVLTHRNLMFQTQAYFTDIDKLDANFSILHPAPLSHGSGCYALPHFAAGALNVIPESGHFEPDEIFELLDFWPNSSFFAAPTMVVRLLAAPRARFTASDFGASER